MSRSSSPFLLYDPEVERTTKKLRKKAQARNAIGTIPFKKGEPSNPIAQPQEIGSPEPGGILKEETESENDMATVEEDLRLCDLTNHDAKDPDSPIKLPDGTPPIEIKLPLLGFLPKFHGKPGEDPYNFLNEFTRLCGIQKRPAGVSEETFRLTVFSFTLSERANAWFRRLAPGSITSWTDLKTEFLEYYFPSTKTTARMKEITSISQ